MAVVAGALREPFADVESRHGLSKWKEKSGAENPDLLRSAGLCRMEDAETNDFASMMTCQWKVVGDHAVGRDRSSPSSDRDLLFRRFPILNDVVDDEAQA